MIPKKMFFTLMNSLEKIDKTIHGLENVFDFNMDDGPLVRAFDDIATMLVEEMELDIDDDIGPVIFQYALVHNWGEESFTLDLGFKKFEITDLDDLYRYLYNKYLEHQMLDLDKNDLEVDDQDE
jgi:hypothetical protein